MSNAPSNDDSKRNPAARQAAVELIRVRNPLHSPVHCNVPMYNLATRDGRWKLFGSSEGDWDVFEDGALVLIGSLRSAKAFIAQRVGQVTVKENRRAAALDPDEVPGGMDQRTLHLLHRQPVAR
jgi:hypothetical protein